MTKTQQLITLLMTSALWISNEETVHSTSLTGFQKSEITPEVIRVSELVHDALEGAGMCTRAPDGAPPTTFTPESLQHDYDELSKEKPQIVDTAVRYLTWKSFLRIIRDEGSQIRYYCRTALHG